MHLCRVRKVGQAEVEVAGEEVVPQQAAEAVAGAEAQRSDALLLQAAGDAFLFLCCWPQNLTLCWTHG